ncbi:Gmad2 immunoglobulin-like domain-containing protein [Dictyobacter kobayashii]|uniref:Bacterial spore germination immunoglobulin-like domain-containing protein n=1 Tax=Dictyobacter kobayashii TaxID=2014872 RepID=A0A402AFM1_9CHLR|nr:Gmad2 immunoglobulin-like domain-containing protein [Dictyobacter kobayashii]GCE17920.1 hypothetical protein KDK_17200 [Dictyobacter kobayashii]
MGQHMRDIPLPSLFKNTIVYLLVLFILAACSLGGGNSTSNKNTTTASTPTPITATPTATPSVKLGSQTCPTAVSLPSYWDTKIPTQANVNQVEKVICANLMGKTNLQALVTVRYAGTGHILDVHVYNNITNPKPDEIFKLTNLYKGDAKVSAYNTLLTSEANQNSPQNHKQPDAAIVDDLQREFKWSDSSQTLVPIAFPGFFPSTTRYQAEADQQQVNQGQEAWQLSPSLVAGKFVANTKLFNWQNGTQTTIVSGGGNNDVDAVVKVERSSAAGKNTVTITMSRLENNANGGIWIIIKVDSPGLSISTPAQQSRIQSPVTVMGKGTAFEGVIGKLMVFDNQYNALGNADVHGQQGMGATSFSTNVSYNPTFKNGSEEGVLVAFSYSSADGSVNDMAMVKAILS